MISFKIFRLSEKFIRINSITYQFGKDSNLEKWADPYDSDSLKFVTVLIYIVNVMASIIMLAFVVYETRGLAGHYRTLINQLLSCQYGAVRFIFLIFLND
jgi:hypothetical protein